jgi:hypothetical protein
MAKNLDPVFRIDTGGVGYDRWDFYRSRSWDQLKQLASAGNDIAVHLIGTARRYSPGGPWSPETVDDLISSALAYMASDRDRLRRELAKKIEVAGPPTTTFTVAKPETPALELADKLLRFVAALPLQDHPIKVQKERAALVNRALQELRPYRNKLL